MDVRQKGDRNAVHGSQTGGSNLVVDQNWFAGPGDGNYTAIIQSGAAVANITQHGPDDNGTYLGGNRAYVTQVGGLATIIQKGDNSQMTVDQMGGTGNEVAMEQSGNAHNAVVKQDGSNNYVSTYQRLWRGDINVDQSGMGQQVYLDQRDMSNLGGGSDMKIVQEDGVGTGGNTVGTSADRFLQSGDGNMLDVMQSGTMNTVLGSQANGGSATIDQTGANNTATVAQN